MRAKQEMNVMARALCEALSVTYHETDAAGAPPEGSWYLRRCDTERALYNIVEAGENGSISHPLTHECLSASEMASALYMARLTLSYAPQRGRYAR